MFDLGNEDQKCAPTKEYSSGSCYSLESLLRMTAAYNTTLSKHSKKSKKYGDPIVIREDKAYLVQNLTAAMARVCDDQLCWMKQKFVRALRDAEINNYTFLPKLSQKKFDWLSTTNIVEKMDQYEIKYKDFKFVGCVPMDFDQLPHYGIRKMNYDELYNAGIRRLGYVFNLDYSTGRGTHWVSMFVNLKHNQIYYFDSCARPPTSEVKALVNRIATWCYHRNILKKKTMLEDSSIDEPFMGKQKNLIEKVIENIKYNTIQHQRKNSECGVYSINFIIRMLNGEKFEDICKNITDDDNMNKCRPIYFRFK